MYILIFIYNFPNISFYMKKLMNNIKVFLLIKIHK